MRTLRLVLIVVSVVAGAAAGTVPSKVRPPAVAGTFYPADPKELAKMVDDFLARAAPPPVDNLVALVAPHAGYVYSGQVAAYSYALLKGRKADRVVVIAPSHYQRFDFSSVYDGTAYATPLGQVPVDRAFAAKLAKMSPLIRLSDVGHSATGERGEHALEVQLPFLQRVLGEFQVVPIVMGDQGYEASRALAVALAKLIQGSNTLIVASSDLSHYYPYQEAVTRDRKLLTAVEEWDYFNLSQNLERDVWEACGGGPIVAAMMASERLGASQARLLKYANTGDVTGDRSRVVGYSAVALVKSPPPGNSRQPAFSLSRQERDTLIEIARKSVETAVRDRKVYECAVPKAEALVQERGAFVTLTKNGELRGCIGYVAPMKPLYLAVRDVAMMAAVRDTRFAPVNAKELPDLEYEISVLSPLRRVLDPQEIKIGQHGLLIRNGDREGILLPQVAADEHWDRLTFLEEVCVKAGLPRHAWQNPDSDLFRFTALIFGARLPVETLTPEELFRMPVAGLTPPAPGSPALTAPPF